MATKAAYKYQLYEYKNPILVFYGVILFLLTMVSARGVVGTAASGEMTVGGLDAATAIFLFVLGLCSFKEPFLMLMQNGVSRKSVYLSRVLVLLTTAFLMAAIDKAVLLVGKIIAGFDGSFSFVSLYEQIFAERVQWKTPFSLYFGSFLFDFFLYLAFLGLGYFITILFYRLNKAGKIAVGVGVPVGLNIVYPLVDSQLFGGGISRAVGRFFGFAFGVAPGNPYAAIVTFAVFFSVISVFSWLLIKKAAVKA